MTRTVRSLITAVVALPLLCAATARGAGTPAAQCAAAKQKAATKAAKAKTKCHSKALLLALPTDPLCLQKADVKLQQDFAKADAKGGCALTGDVASVGTLVDTFVDDLLGLTPLISCPGGQIVGGFCWYDGAISANCVTTCAAHGKVYDDATRTYAGSDGTDANCASVGSALGLPGFTSTLSFAGMGCFSAGFGNMRDTDPTTSTASGNAVRYCACH